MRWQDLGQSSNARFGGGGGGRGLALGAAGTAWSAVAVSSPCFSGSTAA
jgi:hypothetical protein